MYFVGNGVLTFGGKDYGYGKKLPADLPKETIAALKKRGAAVDTMPTAAPGAASSDKALRAELTAAMKACDEGRAELDKERAARTAAEAAAQDAKTELADAQTRIATLQESINTLTSAALAPAGDGAAPAADAGAGPKK